MKSEFCVAIADDHTVVQNELKQAIEVDFTVRVVAESDKGETAFHQIKAAPARHRSASILPRIGRRSRMCLRVID